MGVLPITSSLSVDESEITVDCVLNSGPGGQKVNRTASAVQLRFHLRDSRSLPPDVKARLNRQQRNRINQRGELVVEARRHRSQPRNRSEALERLKAIIERAGRPPAVRRPGKPSQSAVERRLHRKRQQADKKRCRKPPRWDE